MTRTALRIVNAFVWVIVASFGVIIVVCLLLAWPFAQLLKTLTRPKEVS